MKAYSSKIKLFVIDDDADILNVLRIFFANREDIPQYELFSNAADFFKSIDGDVKICIIDYYLRDINGLEIIKRVIKSNPQCWFIMFSGQKNIRVVVEFMNNAYGSRYVEKSSPDALNELLFFIKDITARINTIESYFYESFKVRESISELKSSLSEFKDNI